MRHGTVVTSVLCTYVGIVTNNIAGSSVKEQEPRWCWVLSKKCSWVATGPEIPNPGADIGFGLIWSAPARQKRAAPCGLTPAPDT